MAMETVNNEVLDALEEGIDAAQEIIDNWAKGDLAGAVNGLEVWKIEAQQVWQDGKEALARYQADRKIEPYEMTPHELQILELRMRLEDVHNFFRNDLELAQEDEADFPETRYAELKLDIEATMNNTRPDRKPEDDLKQVMTAMLLSFAHLVVRYARGLEKDAHIEMPGGLHERIDERAILFARVIECWWQAKKQEAA